MYPPSMAGPAPSRNESVNSTVRFSELYFGYASNLSPAAMKGRCPDSLFCGLARLENFKWHINSTQYANIIPSPGDCVYGALYFLSPRDEAGLDESEGVPWLYEKQWHDVERIDANGNGTGQVVRTMTYVDVQRTDEGTIMSDYIVWILKAWKEGKELGLPEEWVEKNIKPWIPIDEWERRGDEERVIEMVRVCAPRPKAQAV